MDDKGSACGEDYGCVLGWEGVGLCGRLGVRGGVGVGCCWSGPVLRSPRPWEVGGGGRGPALVYSNALKNVTGAGVVRPCPPNGSPLD